MQDEWDQAIDRAAVRISQYQWPSVDLIRAVVAHELRNLRMKADLDREMVEKSRSDGIRTYPGENEAY